MYLHLYDVKMRDISMRVYHHTMRVATLKQQQRKDRQRQRTKKQRAAQLQRLSERATKYGDRGVEEEETPEEMAVVGDTLVDGSSSDDSGGSDDRTSNDEAAVQVGEPETAVADVVTPTPSRPLSAVPEESDSARSSSPSAAELPERAVETPDLQQRLEAANAEIARLHEVMRHQKGNVISITYPMPSVNGAALLEPEKFEYMKEVFSGLILELIRTTHAGLEKENRKAFSFYTVQEREVTMHFAETEGL